MNEYTNRDLAEAFGINFPKQKRHAREFLGVDPDAGQSSGVPRKLTLEQAFIVYFCGVAVNVHKLPLSDAKDLAKTLPNWLERRLYFPIKDYLPNRLDRKVLVKANINENPENLDNCCLDWSIRALKTTARTIYTAKGIISGETTEGFTAQKLTLVEESYLVEMLTNEGVRDIDEDIIHITHINVTSVLRKFARVLGL